MFKASDIPELKIWKDTNHLNGASIKKIARQAWKRAYGDQCQSCGCRMHFEIKFRAHRHFATIDHILARGLGGRDILENIQVVCRECNNKKSLDEYHSMPPENY
jgi:5-methylcytosine-specific restriction endonuclease McrA